VEKILGYFLKLHFPPSSIATIVNFHSENFLHFVNLVGSNFFLLLLLKPTSKQNLTKLLFLVVFIFEILFLSSSFCIKISILKMIDNDFSIQKFVQW